MKKDADGLQDTFQFEASKGQAETPTPSGGHASPSSKQQDDLPAALETCKQLRESVKPKRTLPGTAAYASELALLPKATSRTVSVAEAAVVLGKSRPTLYDWEDRGMMPPRVRRRGRKEWHLADIIDFAIRMNITPLLPKS